MIPWEVLDTGAAPGGGAMRLMRRGAEYTIRLDGADLMNSRQTGSEQALASLTLERLRDRPAPRLLIGGLGMGFTLRAAQALAGPQARLVVAEIAPDVIRWARGPLAHLFGDALDDPRLDLRVADVAETIRAAPAGFDAILLDVDNGPEAMVRPANAALYGYAGLGAARRALTPGGVLAVWSVAPDAGFTRRLRDAGFVAQAVGVRTGPARRGPRHTIWLAQRD